MTCRLEPHFDLHPHFAGRQPQNQAKQANQAKKSPSMPHRHKHFTHPPAQPRSDPVDPSEFSPFPSSADPFLLCQTFQPPARLQPPSQSRLAAMNQQATQHAASPSLASHCIDRRRNSPSREVLAFGSGTFHTAVFQLEEPSAGWFSFVFSAWPPTSHLNPGIATSSA